MDGRLWGGNIYTKKKKHYIYVKKKLNKKHYICGGGSCGCELRWPDVCGAVIYINTIYNKNTLYIYILHYRLCVLLYILLIYICSICSTIHTANIYILYTLCTIYITNIYIVYTGRTWIFALTPAPLVA